VHLNLLSAYAENVYDLAGLKAATADIERALMAQPPQSRGSICLLITLGRLQLRQDRGDLAIGNLTNAYRDSGVPGLEEARAVAAEVMSSAMRRMGDFEQALALNQEVIDWDTAH
jgi:hypothetical protein